MSISELEKRTFHSYRLALRWRSGRLTPRRSLFIDSTSNIPVSDIRFIPGLSGDWILAISKGIWDVITIWELSSPENQARKACEWSPRGALFNGLTLNTDPGSDATLAISVLNDGEYCVHLLSLLIDENGESSLRSISTIASDMKPTKLHGDLLALSDDVSMTVMWNWTKRTSAVLQQAESEAGLWHPNRSIQVVFAYRSVLVVRASSIYLFPEPVLQETPRTYSPITQHSFGWIDGVCVAKSRSSMPALSILLRGESDDPWASGHSLDHYIILPNPNADDDSDSPPYIFPPELVAKVPAVRGYLRCRNIVLGPCGTAAWIQPHDRAVVGLAWAGNEEYPLQAIHPASGNESLVVAAFPGPLATSTRDDGDRDKDGNIVTGTRSTTVFTNGLNNWTSLDYDEEIGRIVLCSSFGCVMVLEF